MIDPLLIKDIVKYITEKYPTILIAIIFRENVKLLGGDKKEIAVDVVNFLCKEHPDVIIDLINQFAPRIIETFLNKS